MDRVVFEKMVRQNGLSVERDSETGFYKNMNVEFMWIGWLMCYGRKL